MVFNRARRTEQVILRAIGIANDTTTAHAHRLVVHGESVYNGLRTLEAIALEISSLLATENGTIQRERREIESRILTIFGGHRGTLHILEGREAILNRMSNFWIEARDSLSLGVRAFNGVQGDLMALREHQTSPKSARLYVPSYKQDSSLKQWVQRLEARRVLMPAHVP